MNQTIDRQARTARRPGRGGVGLAVVAASAPADAVTLRYQANQVGRLRPHRQHAGARLRLGHAGARRRHGGGLRQSDVGRDAGRVLAVRRLGQRRGQRRHRRDQRALDGDAGDPRRRHHHLRAALLERLRLQRRRGHQRDAGSRRAPARFRRPSPPTPARPPRPQAPRPTTTTSRPPTSRRWCRRTAPARTGWAASTSLPIVGINDESRYAAWWMVVFYQPGQRPAAQPGDLRRLRLHRLRTRRRSA